MSHELFADAVVRPISPRARRRRRLLIVLSIAIHVVVVVPFTAAQVLSPGPMPLAARPPMVFEAANMIRVIDIPVPRARATTPAAPAPEAPNPNGFPVREPEHLTPEPAEPARPGPIGENVPGGVPTGVDGGLPGRGVVVPPPPPPSPPPQQAIRLFSGMKAPQRLVDVQPVYPAIAVAARKEGIVILEAVLDARGNVDSVKVLRSDPMLEQAAIEAVRQWKYSPGLLNGVAVPVIITVTVNFTLR